MTRGGVRHGAPGECREAPAPTSYAMLCYAMLLYAMLCYAESGGGSRLLGSRSRLFFCFLFCEMNTMCRQGNKTEDGPRAHVPFSAGVE